MYVFVVLDRTITPYENTNPGLRTFILQERYREREREKEREREIEREREM